MTWEISHAPEAWDDFRTNLEAKDADWLAEACAAAAADKAQQVVDDINAERWENELPDLPYDWDRQYEKDLGNYQQMAHDTLVDAAITWAEYWRSCTNGGHEFYIDRTGTYTVPCSVKEEGDE